MICDIKINKLDLDENDEIVISPNEVRCLRTDFLYPCDENTVLIDCMFKKYGITLLNPVSVSKNKGSILELYIKNTSNYKIIINHCLRENAFRGESWKKFGIDEDSLNIPIDSIIGRVKVFDN